MWTFMHSSGQDQECVGFCDEPSADDGESVFFVVGDAGFGGNPSGRVDVDHRSADVAGSGTGHDIRSDDAFDSVPTHELHGGFVSSELARAYDSFDSLRVQPHCCWEPEPYEHSRRDQATTPPTIMKIAVA